MNTVVEVTAFKEKLMIKIYILKISACFICIRKETPWIKKLNTGFKCTSFPVSTESPVVARGEAEPGV